MDEDTVVTLEVFLGGRSLTGGMEQDHVATAGPDLVDRECHDRRRGRRTVRTHEQGPNAEVGTRRPTRTPHDEDRAATVRRDPVGRGKDVRDAFS
jgi:hypothetical protein